MKPYQQVACIRLSITGQVMVDYRFPALTGSIMDSEAQVWREVWHRRDPQLALFIDGDCVECGGFASMEAASAALKLRLHRRLA